MCHRFKGLDGSNSLGREPHSLETTDRVCRKLHAAGEGTTGWIGLDQPALVLLVHREAGRDQ